MAFSFLIYNDRKQQKMGALYEHPTWIYETGTWIKERTPDGPSPSLPNGERDWTTAYVLQVLPFGEDLGGAVAV